MFSSSTSDVIPQSDVDEENCIIIGRQSSTCCNVKCNSQNCAKIGNWSSRCAASVTVGRNHLPIKEIKVSCAGDDQRK